MIMKVVVHGVTKEYVSGEGSLRALGGVSLEIRDREFFGIIGPTGCGKTTLLHIIAGLEKQSAGTVEFIGERHSKSIVSMVFQDAALMPWRTVEENVALHSDQFRVAPGFGFRINVPAMGPAPLAFDFAFPVASAATDQKQVFSFFFGATR